MSQGILHLLELFPPNFLPAGSHCFQPFLSSVNFVFHRNLLLSFKPLFSPDYSILYCA